MSNRHEDKGLESELGRLENNVEELLSDLERAREEIGSLRAQPRAFAGGQLDRHVVATGDLLQVALVAADRDEPGVVERELEWTSEIQSRQCALERRTVFSVYTE